MGAEFRISQSLSSLQPPATLTIGQKAAEMAAAGRSVISMSMGEPDFPPPENVKQAAIAAINSKPSRYTPIAGIPELRAAISRKFKRENSLDYQPNQTIAATGGKQVIYNAFLATLDPGDEVIIPVPSWVSYPDMVTACRGIPVMLPTLASDSFKITPEKLERAITPRTRWLVLNSPSNPTGVLYSEADLRNIGEVLHKHPHVWVLTDDMYEHLVYDGLQFVTFAQAVPEMLDRTLTVNGLSKSFAMPGWRLGFGGGPLELIRAMEKAQGQQTSATCSITQWAAVEALDGPQEVLAERRAIFQIRRDVVFERISAIPLLDVLKPEGAFYLYPSCEKLLGRTSAGGRQLNNDEDVALALLDEEGVGIVHGAAFGSGPNIRLSYAGAEDQLIDACERIKNFCTKTV